MKIPPVRPQSFLQVPAASPLTRNTAAGQFFAISRPPWHNRTGSLRSPEHQLMNQHPHRRTWLLVAAIAISVALVFLMVPHTHGDDSGAWLAILPLLFVGVISPLSLLAPLASIYIGRVPAAPLLPASFQRPPPFQLA